MVLFFYNVVNSTDNGGQIGIQRNLDMCCNVFGKENVIIFKMYQPSRWRLLYNLLSLSGYYSSLQNDRDFRRLCMNYKFDIAFINGALSFNYLEPLKKTGCRIHTYFHNVDYYYYLGKYQFSKNVADWMVAKYIFYCERKTTFYSDVTIALNSRDAEGVKKLYNRDVDLILPIGMEDEGEMRCDVNQVKSHPYCLFVGSDFYANIEGVDWFIKNVAPFIKMDFWVVGTCCSSFEQRKLPNNVFLKGRVESLLPFYKNASCVVSPIFSGSGMKTKTIEALKYGKTIFGTSEAFEGIEVDYSSVGALCNSTQEFIDAINVADIKYFNEYSYHIFHKLYSYSAIFQKYKLFIDKLLK